LRLHTYKDTALEATCWAGMLSVEMAAVLCKSRWWYKTLH